MLKDKGALGASASASMKACTAFWYWPASYSSEPRSNFTFAASRRASTLASLLGASAKAGGVRVKDSESSAAHFLTDIAKSVRVHEIGAFFAGHGLRRERAGQALRRRGTPGVARWRESFGGRW